MFLGLLMYLYHLTKTVYNDKCYSNLALAAEKFLRNSNFTTLYSKNELPSHWYGGIGRIIPASCSRNTNHLRTLLLILTPKQSRTRSM